MCVSFVSGTGCVHHNLSLLVSSSRSVLALVIGSSSSNRSSISHETGREATLKHSRRTADLCKGQFKQETKKDKTGICTAMHARAHLYTAGGGGSDGGGGANDGDSSPESVC